MPKRTKKARAANKGVAKWDNEDELHLVAWLDHCIQSKRKFDATITAHMRATTQKDFTQKQCTDKVKRLWINYGRDRTKVSDVWRKGSSILDSDNLFPGLKPRRSPSNPLDLAFEVPNTDASSTELEEEGEKPVLRDDTLNGSSCAVFQRSIGVQHDDGILASLTTEIERHTRLVAEKEAVVKEQQRRILCLETDLSDTRRYYDKLLQRLHNRNDPLYNPEFLYKLQNDNSVLKRLLEDIRESQSDGLRIKADGLGPTTSATRDELDWLEDRIAKACSAFGCSTSTIEPLPEAPARLRELIARVSGMTIQQFNAHMASTAISGRSLFRSLAAALICELAFEPSFPEPLDVGSLLLYEYREQVLIQGDHSSLENLDLLAHKSLSSNPYFVAKVIPEKARSLALEVFQLLVQWNSHGTQDQSLYLGPEGPREELFQPIFARALAMKMHLLLSKSYYTLVFPAPGTNFNPATMRRHTSKYEGYATQPSRQQMDLDGPPVEPKKEEELIKLCLFPALYAYHKRPSQESSHPQKIDVEKHVVNYRNFFVDDDELISGEPVVISKAIVLL
ncbi:hypothetical protein Hte_004564 [Hypoxylon texense]